MTANFLVLMISILQLGQAAHHIDLVTYGTIKQVDHEFQCTTVVCMLKGRDSGNRFYRFFLRDNTEASVTIQFSRMAGFFSGDSLMIVKSAAGDDVVKLEPLVYNQFPLNHEECVVFYRSDIVNSAERIVLVNHKKCNAPHVPPPGCECRDGSPPSQCVDEGSPADLLQWGRISSSGSGSSGSSGAPSLNDAELNGLREMERLAAIRERKVWESYLEQHTEFRSRSASSASIQSELSTAFASGGPSTPGNLRHYLNLQARVTELEVQAAVLQVEVKRQLSREPEGDGERDQEFSQFSSPSCGELQQLNERAESLKRKTAEVRVKLETELSREDAKDCGDSDLGSEDALKEQLSDEQEELAAESNMACGFDDDTPYCELVSRWKKSAENYERLYEDTMRKLEAIKEENRALPGEIASAYRPLIKKLDRGIQELNETTKRFDKHFAKRWISCTR